MIEVKLIDHTPNVIQSLYMAYRVAYSALTPRQILERIEAEKITEETMLSFIQERLLTGHSSPLQQITFEFGISGVSRAFSHQFVRHHIGIDIEQQSQRYVVFKDKVFPHVIPPTIANHDYLHYRYENLMEDINKFYHELIVRKIPAEDARFILPNATTTNLKINVNYLELQHMSDLRLCTRAQWEFRHVMGKMRGEVNRAFPWLGAKLGPKCMSFRMGYCDESFEDWQACPISRLRPHKSEVIPE